jgi:hypothetical protein
VLPTPFFQGIRRASVDSACIRDVSLGRKLDRVPEMSDFDDDLKTAQGLWRGAMTAHANEIGLTIFPPAAKLRPEHMSDARLYADRYDYLNHLPKHGRVAEVGVWKGNFSDMILRQTQPAQLHLFDLDFTRFAVKDRFAAEAAADRVVFHDGDAAKTMDAMPDAYFDWIYIDAGHDYASVKADALAGARKVKPGGLLIFNDYIFWSHTESRPYGVVQAVNELCTQDGWRVRAFCLQPEMYCDIALVKA